MNSVNSYSRLQVALALNRHDGSDYSLFDSNLSLVCAGPYVLLLNAAKASYEAILKGHQDLVHLARFIPSFGLADSEEGPTFEQEREILSCSADKTVRAWSRVENEDNEISSLSSSSSNWTCTAVLEGHTDSITGLAVVSLPDGSAFCASASADCSLRVWHRHSRTASWVFAARIEHKRSSVMISVALSILPGSHGYSVIMAAGGTDQKVHLYSVTRGGALENDNSSSINDSSSISVVEVLALQGHSDWIRSLSFSRQTELDSHQQHSDQHQHHPQYHQYQNSSSKFLMLASGAQDGKIRLWRISERMSGKDHHQNTISTNTEPRLMSTTERNNETLISPNVFAVADEGECESGAGTDDPDVAALASATMLSSLSPADFDRMLLQMDDIGKSDTSSHALLRRPSTFSVVESRSGNTIQFDVAFDSLLRGHEGWVFSTRWHPPVALALPSLEKPEVSKGCYYQLWQPPCIISSGSDKTVTIWQPRGVTDPNLKSDPSVIWSGVWEPLTRVGTGIGSASLGMYGAILLSDAKTIVAHGFHGALHVWTSSISSSTVLPNERSSSSYPMRIIENLTEFGGQESISKHSITSWTAHSAPSGHFRSVTSLSWAPNGQYLLSSSDDSTSRVWGPVLLSSTGVVDNHQQQWHEISRPQIHGYAIKSICIPNIQGRMHRFFSGSDEKVIRSFDAPELFLSTLSDVCGPALEASGYGHVQDDVSGNGEEDGDGGQQGEPFKRAAFAYVPELGLTNKAVMAALGSVDAVKATQDRYNLDGSDAISQSHDSNAQALRNFALEGGSEESLEVPRKTSTKQSSSSTSTNSSSSSSSSSTSSHLGLTPNKNSAPMEESLVQDSRWPESEKMFGHVNEIISVAASSTGNVIASSCSARDEEAATIWLWDALTSKPIQQILAHKLSVEKIEFSHALYVLKRMGKDSSYIYCIQNVQNEKKGTAKTTSNNDSEFFITSGRDRFVGLFISNGPKRYSLVKLLEGHKRQVWSVSVAPIPDSSQILDDQGVGGENLSSTVPVVHTGVRLFASGARDHSVRFWSLCKGTPTSSSSSSSSTTPPLSVTCVGTIQFDSAVSALAFAPVCRVSSSTSKEDNDTVPFDHTQRFATYIRTLLCVGLESGRIEMYHVTGKRATTDQESWKWTFQKVANNALRSHTGAIQAMAWRPPPLNQDQCNVLTLATGGADGAILWQDVDVDVNRI
jgi:WD40 repeat protein